MNMKEYFKFGRALLKVKFGNSSLISFFCAMVNQTVKTNQLANQQIQSTNGMFLLVK